jgi:hypothetical protein
MKFLLVDEVVAQSLINTRHFQSLEFKQAQILISFLRDELDQVVLDNDCVALRVVEGGYIVCPTVHYINYIVIDFEEAHQLLSLDDNGLLLTLQKTLRFCVKLSSGLIPSKNEKLLPNNKAVVFPYPIGQQTALRVSIDRSPDEKRRAKRENNRAYLIYKFGSSEGGGPKEVPRVTNFRKANEGKAQAYLAATKVLAGNNLVSLRSGSSSLTVTELETTNRAQLYIDGLERWKRVLTNSQLEFIEKPLTAPHRIEGPAGTGKTLCLVLKAINILLDATRAEHGHRCLFVTHSQATKITIENLIVVNDGQPYLETDAKLFPSSRSVVVTTLHELCAHLLGREISETELVDKDAYESKLTQKLYAIEAVEQSMLKEFLSHKPYLSDEFSKYLEATDHWVIAEMLQHEISVQIKGRGEQDLAKYKKLPRLKFGLPTFNEGDKAFVFIMHDFYQDQLVTSAQFDTDDVVLSAMSQLGTPIWRRRRIKEGYDSIFVDETHLFNLNELSVFHKLTRFDTSQPIAYSVDRSQALGDRGWTDDLFDRAFAPEQDDRRSPKTSIKSIFRCSPDITDLAFSVTSSGATLFTNFHNPLTDAVSAFSADEERRCAKPLYLFFSSDKNMLEHVFHRAESMARDLGCLRADIALIACADEIFSNFQFLADERNKPIEVIRSRGDLEAVKRASQSGRYVLSAPEFVGGLEFWGVILIGVDHGRVPPLSSGVRESQAFLNYAAHQRLYVAITRAKYRVEILGDRARGPSETLRSALAADLIELVSGD